MRLVVSFVSQYQHRGLTLEELIEAGKVALRNAAVNYDQDSATKFITYVAVTQMRQSLEVLTTLNCAKKEPFMNTKGS